MTTDKSSTSNVEQKEKVPQGAAASNITPNNQGSGQTTASLIVSVLGLALAVIALVLFFVNFTTLKDLQKQASELQGQYHQLSETNNTLASRFKRSLSEMEEAATKQRLTINQSLQTQQQNIDAKQAAQNQKLLRMESETETINEKLSQHAGLLEKTQANLKALSGQKRTQWLLSEAYYLVRIAGQRLFINRDVQTAQELIKEADDRIVEIGDLNYNYIREAISKDLAALKSLPRIDSEGVMVEINTLIPQISTMSLISLSLPKDNEDGPAVDQQVTGWKSNFNKLLETIRKEWIVVRRYDHKVEPLLSPDEHRNLNQNIVLALQQAQMANLQQQQNLFEQSLEKAIAWIKQFYLHNDTASEQVLAKLYELKEKQIVQSVPKALSSISVLSALVTPDTTLSQREQGVTEL